MDQDGGDDLRVLVAHQIGHALAVHPLQALDTRGIARDQNPVNQRGSFVVTQCLGHDVADVFIRINAERGVALRLQQEVAQHQIQCFAGDRLHARHGGADFLHLFGFEVFHDRSGLILAQREHQYRSFFNAGITHCRSPSS